LPRARWVRGADEVAQLVGLDERLRGADFVVTGEGRLDATSATTKVVGAVAARARASGLRAAAVVGAARADADPLEGLTVELASPEGPGPDPAGEVVAAAARLARRIAG
jgi:glycerate 2-kinase